MPRQNILSGSPGRPGLPHDPSPSRRACGLRERTEARRPEAGNEGVFIARGVVWLGVPDETEQTEGPQGSRRPERALQLLGYAHGPGILDVLRSGGR